MPSPEVLTLAVAGRFFRDYISVLFEVAARQFDDMWRGIKEDFPNPVFMGIRAIGFLLDFPFTPLRAVLENLGRAMLPNAQFYRRFVITGYDAFKLNVQTINSGTLRASLMDLSLVDQFFLWLGGRFFTVLTGGGLISRIRRLMGIETVDDVVRILRGSITRQVALQILRTAIQFFSVGFGIVSLINLGLDWNTQFTGLQQNNPRKFGAQRNRVRTKN